MFQVTFTGNLGADPEQRFSAKGNAMVQVRVAVNSRRSDPEGVWTDHTDWVRVRCMGRFADLAMRTTKGSKVLVVGQLEIDTYDDRDGKTRVSLDCFADSFEVLSALTPRSDQVDGAAAPVGTARATGEDVPF